MGCAIVLILPHCTPHGRLPVAIPRSKPWVIHLLESVRVQNAVWCPSGVYHHLKVAAETIYATGGGTLKREVSVEFYVKHGSRWMLGQMPG